MIAYKEIFLKYGIKPPKKVNFPTDEQIAEHLKEFDSTFFDSPGNDPRLVCAFYLAFSKDNREFKIENHELFIKGFNLNFDLNKMHPNIIPEFDFYVTRDGRFNIFTLEVDDFVNKFTIEQEDMYLKPFDSTYRIKKMFSSTAFDELINEYIHFLESSFDNAFENMDSVKFYTELYEYIIEEQNKLKMNV